MPGATRWTAWPTTSRPRVELGEVAVANLPLPHAPLLELIRGDIPAEAETVHRRIPGVGAAVGAAHRRAAPGPGLRPGRSRLCPRTVHSRLPGYSAPEHARVDGSDHGALAGAVRCAAGGRPGPMRARCLVWRSRSQRASTPCWIGPSTRCARASTATITWDRCFTPAQDFMIIDFEGEPARPLSERRMKRSPLQDVAGMLRSFHYAAYAAYFSQAPGRRADARTRTLGAFLASVGLGRLSEDLHGGRPTSAAFLPSSPDEVKLLLDVYLVEKAVYELGYELNNRPGWVTIPLEGHPADGPGRSLAQGSAMPDSTRSVQVSVVDRDRVERAAQSMAPAPSRSSPAPPGRGPGRVPTPAPARSIPARGRWCGGQSVRRWFGSCAVCWTWDGRIGNPPSENEKRPQPFANTDTLAAEAASHVQGVVCNHLTP